MKTNSNNAKYDSFEYLVKLDILNIQSQHALKSIQLNAATKLNCHVNNLRGKFYIPF